MTFRKIIYFILLIISVFFYVLFIGDLSFYFLIFTIAMPIVLFIILIIGKFTIKCSITPVNDMAVKKDIFSLNLKITNKSIFPFPNGVIRIETQNVFSNIKESMLISVPIHPRTEQNLNFNIASDYCGIVKVNVKSLRIFDYIKLFSIRIKQNSQTEIFIIPNISVDIPYCNPEFIFSDESEKFSEIKSGDDPSEIFDLKEYAPGDKISRIHWNLSSKQNTLISKYYSLGISSSTAIIPDISFKAPLTAIDTALELFYYVSFALLENNTKHEIYQSDMNDFINIDDICSLNEYYKNFLKTNSMRNFSNELINELCINKSKAYFISNKPNEYYENNTNTLVNFIFTDNKIPEADFKQSENVRISKIPVGMASEYLQEIII